MLLSRLLVTPHSQPCVVLLLHRLLVVSSRHLVVASPLVTPSSRPLVVLSLSHPLVVLLRLVAVLPLVVPPSSPLVALPSRPLVARRLVVTWPPSNAAAAIERPPHCRHCTPSSSSTAATAATAAAAAAASANPCRRHSPLPPCPFVSQHKDSGACNRQVRATGRRILRSTVSASAPRQARRRRQWLQPSTTVLPPPSFCRPSSLLSSLSALSLSSVALIVVIGGIVIAVVTGGIVLPLLWSRPLCQLGFACCLIVLRRPPVISSRRLVVPCPIASVAILFCAALLSSRCAGKLLRVARLRQSIWLHCPLVLSSCLCTHKLCHRLNNCVADGAACHQAKCPLSMFGCSTIVRAHDAASHLNYHVHDGIQICGKGHVCQGVS